MTQKITRVPRPMGTTSIAINYQNNQSEINKDELYRHIVTQYTLQGFRYNGIPIAIPKFASLIGLHQQQVMGYVSTVSENLGAFNNKQNVEDTLKTITTLSTNYALEDRGIIMRQLEVLLRSQGNQYRPFISSEVNKALKLALDSNRNIMEIYRTFFTNTSTNVNILNIYGNKDSGTEFLTPAQALNILDERNQEKNRVLPEGKDIKSLGSGQNPNILSEEEANQLFEKHSLASSPSCIEGRTGTEALRAIQPDNQLVTKPKRRQPDGQSGHEAFEARRGNDYIDYDEVN